MELIDDVLFEFRGQLSYNDILHMTNKELAYLREHRRKIYSNKDVMQADAIQNMAGI